jgi:hypothetical protein
MKKTLIKTVAGLAAATLILTGCGSPQELTVAGKSKEYPTYGFINADTMKSANVCYEVSIGNVIWSIVLVETIAAPIYFLGFSLFNPVSVKNPNGSCGIDGK